MSEKTPPLSCKSPVTALPGVGARRAETLAKLGIFDIEGLLRHYPARYEDRRRPVPVSALADGEKALVHVRVLDVKKPPAAARGGKAPRIPMKVACCDESGRLTLVFFTSRWLLHTFHEGDSLWVYGTAHRDMAGVSMAHPDFEKAAAGDGGGAGGMGKAGVGIVPVYPLTAGVTQRYLRGLLRAALPAAERAEDILPQGLVAERRLAPASFALVNIHFPADEHALNAARYRLVYEELFLLQARLLYARGHAGGQEEGEPTCMAGVFAEDAAGLFGFELTGAQRRAIEEVRSDMAAPAPMRRLLQGDVGSGKTAVAASAAFFAVKSGFQTAIMAPTEILAAQHLSEFERFFAGTGIRAAMLASGLPQAEKDETKAGLEDGSIHVAIGTHALLEPDVAFARLGLVVTDEQHRFGVRQRLSLREKGASPDTLVMTATPIPRTLALMLYADLDVSALDEMPPGRKAVTTRFIDSSKRDAAYGFAEKQMAAGRQVYVVAHKIGDGEDRDEDAGDDGFSGGGEAGGFDGGGEAPLPLKTASALGLAEELSALFPHRKVGVLHGRMKGGQKEETMRAFADGSIDLLVSTVVIEVGVNVPNATMMIVEGAERFGLAQLHQLRGRVGRGAAKSYCVLISDSKAEIARKRGETLARENDGFRIAELDLVLRGPGDLFGVRQHGLPMLRIADPAKHMEILCIANEDAKKILQSDPGFVAGLEGFPE
ncbi:MAG: ATP-dependent DNA helicase RecG [Clostridiales bacterium]|nr:ATP-dependent DNA helicase RecG [Clostridiales bacterium]